MKSDLFKRVKVMPNIDTLKMWNRIKFKKMQEDNSDILEAITGYEGTGKSYLALDLFEDWYDNIIQDVTHVPVTQETLKFYAGSDVDWAHALLAAKHEAYYMIAHDEAVNIIYSKDATTSKNKEINRSFKQIRGKKWFHLMLIPQPQRIDREIREDRLQTLYYVFKHKGYRYVAVYPRQKLSSVLAELNRAMESTAKDIKKKPNILDCDTYPAMICKIPEYKGKLLQWYKPKKSTVMDDSVEKVAATIIDKSEERVTRNVKTTYPKVSDLDIRLAKAYHSGIKPKELKKSYGIKHNQTIYDILKKVAKEGIVFETS